MQIGRRMSMLVTMFAVEFLTYQRDESSRALHNPKYLHSAMDS